MRALYLTLVAVFLAGCQKRTLPEYFLLGDLRVVAIGVDKPEVSPGDTVTLTPLVSDIQGAGRALTYSAVACADPGINFGADPGCDGRADRVVIADGVAVPGLSAPGFTGTTPAVSVTIPADVLLNRGEADRYNGVPYLVVYTVTAAGGPSVPAIKRVLVSTKTEKNQNPAFESNGIVANDAPLTALPTAPVKLLAKLATGAVERYTSLSDDGSLVTRNETLVVSWFASDGDLDDQKTAYLVSNEWQPPAAAPAGRGVVLIAVVRDLRGGLAHFVLTL